ncbi:UDP-glucosyltransferase 2 isoform X3 [Procambarus clarkii]
MRTGRMQWGVLAALLLATTGPSAGYRVLVLIPLGSRSLYHLSRSLSEALGDAGHSVTLVSSFEASTHHGNVTEVHTGSDNLVMTDTNIFDIGDKIHLTSNFIEEATVEIVEGMWTNPAVHQLWERRNDFHAIIITSYINEVAVPFLLGYNGVYITFVTPGIVFTQIAQQGNILSAAVVPSLMLPFTQHMTFLQRAINPIVIVYRYVLHSVTVLPRAQKLLEEYFPGMPPLRHLYSNSSLTLINSHFAVDGPVPLLPTQVEVGTISAKKPRPLPQDLEEFMEGAGENGVILFSLGSIVKSFHIPQEYKVMLVEAFRQLPQRVVWKYEGDDLHLPPNVLTRKWIPQQDILGHRRTRVFVSHCGNQGTQEALYHGVPVLAMPIAFDQPRNAARLANKGYALVLNWQDLSVDAFLQAINTLINDPS